MTFFDFFFPPNYYFLTKNIELSAFKLKIVIIILLLVLVVQRHSQFEVLRVHHQSTFIVHKHVATKVFIVTATAGTIIRSSPSEIENEKKRKRELAGTVGHK